jgi:hypothetical protein
VAAGIGRLSNGCIWTRTLEGHDPALHHAQDGWTACLGGSATAQLNPSLSGCPVAAFDVTGQPFAARTLVAFIRFHVVLQLAGRISMVRLVEATIEQIDTSLRGPFLDLSRRRNFCSVQLQLPQTYHQ